MGCKRQQVKGEIRMKISISRPKLDRHTIVYVFGAGWIFTMLFNNLALIIIGWVAGFVIDQYFKKVIEVKKDGNVRHNNVKTQMPALRKNNKVRLANKRRNKNNGRVRTRKPVQVRKPTKKRNKRDRRLPKQRMHHS